MPSRTASWTDAGGSPGPGAGDGRADLMGELARVLGAAAAGDLSQAVNLDPEGRPLQGEARRLGGLVNGMVSQLAEAARTRAELREKAEQLALSSRYKSEFLANMSHELRTPLNSLLILARLLADNAGGNLTPKQVEFARTIHSSGAELLSLINDILDLAKIESGTVSLAIAQERFADLADHVERTFRQVAADKGLALRLRLDPSLPPVLETDGKRLRQVLTNLLSNAFKFTARGSVELAIGRAAHEQVAFAVTDTGIGIAPAQQRLIFEAFRQADGATGREYGGTGLGLSISRELASLLGGEIRLRSAPGAGSTFTLVLPLRPRAAGGGAVLPPRPAPLRVELPRGAWPALAGRRVLVVDDDIRNVFALTSTLELQRMQVLHAGSGHEAIERLRERRGIDLVLMDVMMPGLDGLDAIRRLRAEPGAAALPVIAVTAKAMPGDRERCLAAGANDYVPKPVRIEALLDAMQRLMPASPETA